MRWPRFRKSESNPEPNEAVEKLNLLRLMENIEMQGFRNLEE